LLTVIDLGIFLWTAGLTLFLVGVSWGGVIYPWKSAAVISSMVIGVVLLVILGFWESFATLKYPAIPVKFFANRGFISLVCCATVASVSVDSADDMAQTDPIVDVLLLCCSALATASSDAVHNRRNLRGMALGKKTHAHVRNLLTYD
jgi:hypothetical protein